MARTYLEMTNDILGEMNEVKLTTSNFANATGIQAFVKNAINRAYASIVNENPEQPWLLTNTAQDDDASEYGNAFIDTVVGQRWYYLKKHSTGSSGTAKDFERVDFDSFYLTTDNVGSCSITGVCSDSGYTDPDLCVTNGNTWTDYDYQAICESNGGTWTATHTSPYERENLSYISFEEWKDHFRESDDAARDTGVYSEPSKVFLNPDGRRFGVSPLPNKVYRIYFTAWNQFERLVNAEDEPLFSDQWTDVLIDTARKTSYMFKEQVALSQLSAEEAKRGMKNLQNLSGNKQADTMSDDRVRF